MTDFDPTLHYLERTKARDYVRWVMAQAASDGDTIMAAQMYASRWTQSKSLQIVQKAAISPGTTSGWGDDLAPLRPLASAFLALVRPRTILGRLAGVRSVPFSVRFPKQTGGAGAGWVGEGKPVPLGAQSLESVTFKPSKIAGMAIATRELARSTSASAESLIEADLISAIATFSDQALLDPTIAEVADVSPASISYGAPSVPASGTTAAAFRADAKDLIEDMTAAGCEFAIPYWVMTPRDAIGLALLGVDDNLSLTGGTLLGVPVLTSTATPTDPGTGSPITGAGSRIFLIDAADLQVADDGMETEISTSGSVELSTAPTDPPAASTVMVSLWQEGLFAVKATRYLSWNRRVSGSVGFITGANYGDA